MDVHLTSLDVREGCISDAWLEAFSWRGALISFLSTPCPPILTPPKEHILDTDHAVSRQLVRAATSFILLEL